MTIQRETESVMQHEPRGQGDIIRIEWPEGETGPRLGVVINADCDLAHGRTDGTIAFLPIYPFGDYLAQFWAPSHLQEVIASATQSVLQLVGDSDEAALHTWLRTSGVDAVCSALTKQCGFKRNQIDQLNRELARLEQCLNTEKDILVRFKNICNLKGDSQSYARIQIANAKKAMGDGHFFISDLVDEPSLGFVVRMRRIYSIPESYFFISKSDQMSESRGDRPTAVRIARLTELYRFRVVQLFAQQYSRVGLPDEVTALSSLAVDDLVAKILGAPQ